MSGPHGMPAPGGAPGLNGAASGGVSGMNGPVSGGASGSNGAASGGAPAPNGAASGGAPGGTPSSRRLVWVWAVLCSIPLLLGVAVAIALAVSGEHRMLASEMPIQSAFVIAGVVCTLIALGVWLGPVWVRTIRARARQDGVEAQRQEHHRFLARLDHELKNPITAIRAALAATDGVAQSPHLTVVDAQTKRLTSLVGELRKLAELETVPIEREIVRLDELARDAVATVHEQLAAAGAQSTHNIAVVFPQAPWPLPPIEGDMDLLFLAIYNIVSNAAKYSGDGANIEVRGTDADGWVEVEVADTGRGIPARDLPFVWDELARGENARGVAGSGLGLALVRSIVWRHHGQVAIRSLEGTGTSVRLRLPHVQP